MFHMGRPATSEKRKEVPAHLRRVDHGVRLRRAAVLELLMKEVGIEDMTDVIIRGGLHKPARAYAPDDLRAAEKFRQTVRRTIYNDIEALTAKMSADRAARLPMAAEIYERQQAALYEKSEQRWRTGLGHPIIVSKAGELAERASQNLAVVRGLDIKPKQKIEHDIGERAAKAQMQKLGEVWKKRREARPQISNAPGDRPVIDVTATTSVAIVTPLDDDDTDDYN